MNHYPPEVLAYLSQGPRRVVSVRVKDDYVIIAEFDDGAVREYDMEPCLTGMLSVLRDKAVFAGVHVDDLDAIAWDTAAGHIDTSADTVYIYGKTLPEPTA